MTEFQPEKTTLLFWVDVAAIENQDKILVKERTHG